ncbi:MAG: hypothetical protein KBG10_03020 [Anaerolineaceae bacterium]|nr:hypothetical protein [Anaerolineaceae bacterium]
MPSLKATIAKYDLDFLQRIARGWGIEISERDVESARKDLLAQISDPEVCRKRIECLPEPVRVAWESLGKHGGRQNWAEFSRLHGEIRAMGPARREREDPDLHPVSTSEVLWYSGLIGKAFLKSSGDLVEYAFIPDDWLGLFPAREVLSEQVVRPAVSQVPRYSLRTGTLVLDHLTDMLAAYRVKRPIPAEFFSTWQMSPFFLVGLLRSANLLNSLDEPDPKQLKHFFSLNRGEALLMLFNAWQNSREINELRNLETLTLEGSWENDPLKPRQTLIELLQNLQTETWWSISSLISLIKEIHPDFQRTAGDYDSWFIRDAQTGVSLQGFANWDQLEGKLMHFLLTGPLHWFGAINLARGGTQERATAFQLDPRFSVLLKGEIPSIETQETGRVKVKDTTRLHVPAGTPRSLRYQIGRFGELKYVTPTETVYQLTVPSLQTAADQGLLVTHLLQLLDREQVQEIPASLRQLGQRWQKKGVEVDLAKVSLLRFKEAETCANFVRSTGERFTLELLNPTTVLIRPSQQVAILKFLNERGILVEVGADV